MKGKQYEGFVQGIAYAAARVKENNMDAYDLIKASSIPLKDFKKYVAEEDLAEIEEELNIATQ
ncbi:hypothetical protein ABC382_00235 [Lysinibacillus sp. 1P01SD]|uniref:hypothetical protein n=1 Tax=Lysinibacillus sp. 1P01SD TaxID=3132285 RepID=UPI00399F27F6